MIFCSFVVSFSEGNDGTENNTDREAGEKGGH